MKVGPPPKGTAKRKAWEKQMEKEYNLYLEKIVERHDDWVTKKLIPEAINTFRDFVKKYFE